MRTPFLILASALCCSALLADGPRKDGPPKPSAPLSPAEAAAQDAEMGQDPPPPAMTTTNRAKATTISAAWRQMAEHNEGNGCGDDLIFDYGADGGMRNFFCRGLTYFSWKTFLSLAPVKPFRAGPHKGSKLNLNSARDFGRYDPKFVQWAVDNLVPAANDAALRAATQPAYDSQVRALARTYAHAYRTVTADPAWLKREVDLYLRSADDPSQKPDMESTSLYFEVLGTDAQSWNGYDPNHVRSATMFWLRRTKDGTAALFFEGLTKLLRTYDKEWLDTLTAQKPGPLPQRPAPNGKPEYR